MFDPYLEARCPAPVAHLRRQIVAADALLLASPEYAHGVSGVMKDALNWMVGLEVFVYKPVAVLNAPPRQPCAGGVARRLSTMSARLIDDASIAVPLLGSGLDEQGIVEHPQLGAALQAALLALRAAVMAQA